MESLRIEPPVIFSSPVCMIEDTKIGPFTVRKGDNIHIDMQRLHQNKKEWQQPLEYLPERFDPNSPLYLTPEGKKRHPLSFAPFLGGKRICLGKTFVETMSKIISPTILYNFEFEFTNKDHLLKKPENNTTCIHEPSVVMKIRDTPLQ